MVNKNLAVIRAHPEYKSYLYLRRQLGEQENGDTSKAAWDKTWPFQQKIVIGELVDKVEALQKGRDLSWDNYRHDKRIQDQSYQTEEEWEAAPLFIKCAIIPGKAPQAPASLFGGIDGSGLYPGHAPVSESRDRPKGIVDNW